MGQASPPIHPLASSQGAVFLVNSCQGYFRCAPICIVEALFRSYGCFFAEFLGDLSLVRLSLLDSTTCVGLRYGSTDCELRDFSWRLALLDLSARRRTSSVSLDFPLARGRPDLPNRHPYCSNTNPITRQAY